MIDFMKNISLGHLTMTEFFAGVQKQVEYLCSYDIEEAVSFKDNYLAEILDCYKKLRQEFIKDSTRVYSYRNFEIDGLFEKEYDSRISQLNKLINYIEECEEEDKREAKEWHEHTKRISTMPEDY